MTAATTHFYPKSVLCPHKRPWTNFKGSHRQARPIVQPINFVKQYLASKTIADHRIHPLPPFLGRLKYKMNCAVKTTVFGKHGSRPKQHCSMPIMSTGVHETRALGGIWQISGLMNAQTIHISAQSNLLCCLPQFQGRHNSGGADRCLNILNPKIAQFFHNEIGSLCFFKTKFWVLVKMAAPGAHILF